MKQFKLIFSVKPEDLSPLGPLMKAMVAELVSKNPSLMKRGPQELPTAQLNASNLQKQQQALSQQQAQKPQHQRSASRNNVPAAPTSSHAPFQFGASAGSPQGNPVYSSKPPSTTRDNIQLPKNKKQKMGSGNASASTSPQIPKTSSPSAQRQQTIGAKVEPSIKTLPCPEQECGASFISAEDLKKHNEEQHIRPLGDPAKFSTDALAELLGLDSNGELKFQSANYHPSQAPAPKMELSSSAQNQTSAVKAESGATSSSMSRQMSAPAGILKQTHSPAAQQNTSTPGNQTVNKSVQEQPRVEDPWAAAGIDPNLLTNSFELFSTNNETWRSITPNDTPESSKDGISEPNSDISEGVDLTIRLDMFDNPWDAFPGGDLQYNIGNLNFDDDDLMGEGSGLNNEFTWDDIPPPTGKVQDFSSYYMMSTE